MGKFGDALRRAEEERREGASPVARAGAPAALGPGELDSRVVAYLAKASPEMEQFRMLRTNIMAIDPANPPRVLAVTSSVKKEGKSLTTLNLGATFAEQRDIRVLVVDADLRRPSLAGLLGIEARFGLSHLLTRDLPLHKAVRETPIPHLHLMPAGEACTNPAELLGSRQMSDLIEVLRTEFDFVLFDTPPILCVHDMGILGARMDGVVYVIKLHVTDRLRVQHGLDILERGRARILGLVLTNVMRDARSSSVVSEYYHYHR
ncbi:MAG: CpsD/CapB family tyrosine-protein kinase [Planctomycetes bacterium]|nr:CpsD/CapB family tyrosine-protein kinase [Planctomycetota bacterium]